MELYTHIFCHEPSFRTLPRVLPSERSFRVALVVRIGDARLEGSVLDVR